MNFGLIERLMDAQIGGAGNGFELFQKVVRELAGGFHILPADLHVDGRGQAEVQDLADDVGGNEIKRDAGKFARQPFANLAHVFLGRPMVFLERNQNIGVHGADGRGRAVGHVDGAVREADVVDDAGEFPRRNDALMEVVHQVAEPGGFFDARGGLGAEVQIESAGIGGREKILAEPGNQQKDRCAGRQE